MKLLIITAAGQSTRFSQSLGYECLKCIYYPNDVKESLLYRMFHQPAAFDRYIVVGGYKFNELEQIIGKEFADYAERITLVENTHYADYGSGYSLYQGLKAAMQFDFTEIVFAEGDLFVDSESFVRVFNAGKNVITCNREAILADKAVAFYYDMENKPRYIYDTSHNAFKITESFRAIYNSGQIWKFADAVLLRKTFEAMTKADWKGTNLVLVEKYFRQLKPNTYDIVAFERWINCNTVSDFEKI